MLEQYPAARQASSEPDWQISRDMETPA